MHQAIRQRRMDVIIDGAGRLAPGELRELRLLAGLESRQMAHHLRVSPEHYSRCENGHSVLSKPADKYVRCVVAALHLSHQRLRQILLR